jgi:PAS domain S-box-containing protein
MDHEEGAKRSSRHESEQTNAIYRAVLDAAPAATFIIGGDGAIIRVNREAESLFGYEEEELVGQPVDMLVPEQLRASH